MQEAKKIKTSLLVTIIVSILFSLWTAGVVIYSIHELRQVSDKRIYISDLLGKVMLYDEALTMSASVAAESANPKWEERYNAMDLRLSATFSELEKLVTARLTQKTQKANELLVELERASLKASKAGDKKAAKEILESKKYAENKILYSEGMTNLTKQVQIEAQEESAKMNHLLYMLFSVLIAAYILTILFSFKAYRFISGWTDQLVMQMIHKSKLSSLGELSAGIAHEINNPLAIIASSAELLPRFSNNPEKLSSKVAAIKKSCERISRIIFGLKKFSRSGEKSDHEIHDLCKIAEEALILTQIKSKRHSTPVTLEYKTCGNILCDEIEIEQVVINLINNAIDAVKEKKDRWVEVKIVEEPHSVVLRVIDSGNGIPSQIQTKLFSPFFTTKKIGEGTGLGLSICRGILDEHRATIEVLKKHPNTCFEIRFPKAKVLPKEVKNVA